MRHLLTFLVLVVYLMPDAARAGVLGGVSTHWRTFSLRPLGEEATPNYFGYGVGANFGYSLGKIFDLGAYVNYTPSQIKAAGIGEEDLQLVEYGGQLAFRIGSIVYLGFRGGRFAWRRIRESWPGEPAGYWRGPGGAISLGAFGSTGKVTYVQFSVDVGSAVLTREDRFDETSRSLDSFGITLTYVFIGLDLAGFDNVLLNNYFGF